MSAADVLEQILGDISWHQSAACRPQPGADVHRLFMPDAPGRLGQSRVEDAQQICLSCVTRSECAEAGREQMFGVWAGQPTRMSAPSSVPSVSWKPGRI